MVLEGHVGDLSSAEDKNLFHQFISLSMSSGKYQVGSSALAEKVPGEGCT